MQIHEITVITRNPRGDNPRDMGSCEIGFYTMEGTTLTMVNADGAPLRNAAGERITRQLAPGDDPYQIASRFTLSRWRNERSADGTVPGFGQGEPLHYRDDFNIV